MTSPVNNVPTPALFHSGTFKLEGLDVHFNDSPSETVGIALGIQMTDGSTRTVHVTKSDILDAYKTKHGFFSNLFARISLFFASFFTHNDGEAFLKKWGVEDGEISSLRDRISADLHPNIQGAATRTSGAAAGSGVRGSQTRQSTGAGAPHGGEWLSEPLQGRRWTRNEPVDQVSEQEFEEGQGVRLHGPTLSDEGIDLEAEQRMEEERQMEAFFKREQEARARLEGEGMSGSVNITADRITEETFMQPPAGGNAVNEPGQQRVNTPKQVVRKGGDVTHKHFPMGSAAITTPRTEQRVLTDVERARGRAYIEARKEAVREMRALFADPEITVLATPGFFRQYVHVSPELQEALQEVRQENPSLEQLRGALDLLERDFYKEYQARNAAEKSWFKVDVLHDNASILHRVVLALNKIQGLQRKLNG